MNRGQEAAQEVSHEIATAFSEGVFFIGIQRALKPEELEQLLPNLEGWANEPNPDCTLLKNWRGREYADATVRALSIGLRELTGLPNKVTTDYVRLVGQKSTPFNPVTDIIG